MNKKEKSINFGDRIFARVTRDGQTVYNFVSEKVSNMADLVAQLRRAMKDIHGLVMIHIRNYNRGWGIERPLMLYASESIAPNISPLARKVTKPSMQRQMLFPWETH